MECPDCGAKLIHGHEPWCEEGPPAPPNECSKCGAPCNGKLCLGCLTHQE